MQTRRRFSLAVFAGIAFLGAATLLGFLDRFAWPFELATFFRLQYAAVLLILVLPALVLCSGRTAAAAALLAALNLVVVAPAPEGSARAAADGAALRVLLANVEVGNDRYGDLARLVRRERPDVVGVIELDRSWAGELERRLPAFDERLLVAREDAYGIGILSRVPLDARIERFPRDGPPTIVAQARPPGAPALTLVLTHVHTPFAGSIHERHLEALAAARPRLGSRLAVCGDFNAVPWSSAFRRLADRGLTDLYDGSLAGYSWPTWSPLLRLPIDNCLVGGLAVREHRRGPNVGSDHFPLIVDLLVPRS